MKKYTDLVNKEIKARKKKSLISIIGIMIGIILLTFTMATLEFNNRRDIKFARTYVGDYDFEYKVEGDSKKQIDILDKNTLIKDYALVGESNNIKADILGKETDVNIMRMDKNAIDITFKEGLEVALEKGELPKSSDEIIINNKAKNLGLKILDKVNIEGKEYKIVGIYKDSAYEEGVKFIAGYSYNANDRISIYTRLNTNRKNIATDITSIASVLGFKESVDSGYGNFPSYENMEMNQQLVELTYRMDFNSASYLQTPMFMQDLLIGLIMLISIAASYGLINFSMSDKTKQFAILRCMGATPKQIRTLVYKEIIGISIKGIIPAIIIGYGLAYGAINFLVGSKYYDSYGLTMGIYPIIILKTLIISIVTVFLASFSPAKNASKISPMEGIRSGKKDNGHIKKRKSKFIRKIFGIEGEVAYRNLRAKPVMFWVSTVLLTLSFIIFVVFTTYINAIVESSQRTLKTGKRYELSLSRNPKIKELEGKEYEDYTKADYELERKSYNQDLFYALVDDKKNVEKYLKENGVKTDIISSTLSPLQLGVFAEGTNGLTDKLKNTDSILEFTNKEGKTELITMWSDFYIYNDDAFNSIKDRINGDNVNLEAFNNNGVIIIESMVRKKNLDAFVGPAIDFKSGDKIDLTFRKWSGESDHDLWSDLLVDLTEEKINKAKQGYEKYSFNIIGSIKPSDLIELRGFSQENMGFIVSESFFNKNMKTILGEYKDMGTPSTQLLFDFESGDKSIDQVQSELRKNYEVYVFDRYEELEYLKGLIRVLKIVAYGFLSVVILTLIGTIIINKNMTVNSRKKEYGTMLAIGMEKKSLRKSVMLEAIIQWLIVCAVAIPISVKTSSIILSILVLEGEISNSTVSITLVIFAIIMMFIIILITSVIPFRKFKNFDMVEMMKEEE